MRTCESTCTSAPPPPRLPPPSTLPASPNFYSTDGSHSNAQRLLYWIFCFCIFMRVCCFFFPFFFFIKSQRPKCNRSSKITVRSAIADRPSVYRAPDRSSGHWPLRKIDSVSDSRTEKIKSNSGSGEGMILDGRKFSRDIRPPAVPLRISCSNFSCHGRSVRIVLTTVCQWNF